jgi:hypothetical protein
MGLRRPVLDAIDRGSGPRLRLSRDRRSSPGRAGVWAVACAFEEVCRADNDAIADDLHPDLRLRFLQAFLVLLIKTRRIDSRLQSPFGAIVFMQAVGVLLLVVDAIHRWLNQ